MRRPAPVLAALALAGCASGTAAGGAPAGSGLTGDITVLAAASLTETFTTLGEQFEAQHPGVTVTFGFASSSALARQAVDGAPADVLATASVETMGLVVAAGAASAPDVLATNRMAVAVPPGNPGRVTRLADLEDPDVTTALCQPAVPCGATAAKVLAGLDVTPVTLEPDVRGVLSKVRLGEVDAGLVYVTDVVAAGDDVQGIDVPDDVDASTDYPVATLTRSAHPDVAQAFVDLVLSPAGADVLTAAGFGPP